MRILLAWMSALPIDHQIQGQGLSLITGSSRFKKRFMFMFPVSPFFPGSVSASHGVRLACLCPAFGPGRPCCISVSIFLGIINFFLLPSEFDA